MGGGAELVLVSTHLTVYTVVAPAQAGAQMLVVG